MVKKMQSGHTSALPSLFGGAIATQLLMLLLSIPTSLAVYYSTLSEQLYLPLSRLIIALGSGSGAFLAARLRGRHGLLMGLLVACLSAILAMLLGSPQTQTVIQILCYLLPGMIGGVLGVNIESKTPS